MPMNSSEYMPVTARVCCLVDEQKIIRGQPFTTLERDAQLSFILDNPSLPIGSRKTWEVFIKETGSSRNSGSYSPRLFSHFSISNISS